MKILSDIKPVRGAKRVGDHWFSSFANLVGFFAFVSFPSEFNPVQAPLVLPPVNLLNLIFIFWPF